MKTAKDIQSLKSIVGDDFGDYREIVRDELASKCQARWPLLAQGLSAEPVTTTARRGRRRERPWTSVDLPVESPAVPDRNRATQAAPMPMRTPERAIAALPVLPPVITSAPQPAKPQPQPASNNQLGQLFKRIESTQRAEAGLAADIKLKLFKKAA